MIGEKRDRKEKVVLFGTGSFAEVAYYYLEKDSPYAVVAFTADRDLITREKSSVCCPLIVKLLTKMRYDGLKRIIRGEQMDKIIKSIMSENVQ